MRSPDTRTRPHPGDVWISRPPYLFLAHILDVDDQRDPALVSYVLHDEDGFVLERVSQTALDRDWWHAFQPMERRYG
jgi:hypothetical protein